MIRIVCIGDSTMQYNDCTTYPQTGWPQALDRFMERGTSILDFAKNGYSTKSFRDEGFFQKVIDILLPGDFVLIEFGHNDEKLEDPSRGTHAYGSYQENLRYFAGEIRAKKALPVILTSIARRRFGPEGKMEETHGEYPAAALAVARELAVPSIDMSVLTRKMIESAGEKRSRHFFMNFDPGMYANYPEGKSDNTHLRFEGAFHIAGVAAEALSLLGKDWQDYGLLSSAVIKTPADQVAMLASLPEEP